MPRLGLGAAKRFVDNFIWSQWHFEVNIFDLVSVGCGERIDETVKWGKVTTIGALDGLLDAVVARDSDRVGSAHVGEVLNGIGFATPFGEPFFKRLTAGKHRSQCFGVIEDTRLTTFAAYPDEP